MTNYGPEDRIIQRAKWCAQRNLLPERHLVGMMHHHQVQGTWPAIRDLVDPACRQFIERLLRALYEARRDDHSSLDAATAKAQAAYDRYVQDTESLAQ